MGEFGIHRAGVLRVIGSCWAEKGGGTKLPIRRTETFVKTGCLFGAGLVRDISYRMDVGLRRGGVGQSQPGGRCFMCCRKLRILIHTSIPPLYPSMDGRKVMISWAIDGLLSARKVWVWVWVCMGMET